MLLAYVVIKTARSTYKKTNQKSYAIYSAHDSAYDSLLNHAAIWYKLKAKFLICLAKDAVINKKGKLERIYHWANKLWKLGVSKCMKIDDKLKFLYKNGRQEQVGRYLRNQNLEDKTFPDSCKPRSECEKIHGHIKKLHTT